jgi:hypothetical protein
VVEQRSSGQRSARFQVTSIKEFSECACAVAAGTVGMIDPPYGSCKAIDECPLMSGSDYRSGILIQSVFESLPCRDVEMIQRFIEQQQIRFSHDNPRKDESRSFAIAQRRDRREYLIALKQKVVEEISGFRFGNVGDRADVRKRSRFALE